MSAGVIPAHDDASASPQRAARAKAKGVPSRVALHDPTTGRLDRRTRVVEKFRDMNTGVQLARVRHAGGYERHVAVPRLRLLGRSFRTQRRALERIHRNAIRSIEETFGVKVDVRASTLRKEVLARLVAEKTNLDDSKTEYAGYRQDGRVWLERDYSSFLPIVRIHEYLHAAQSPAFTRDVLDFVQLEEGMPQYLTSLVCAKKGIPFVAVDGYNDVATKFAEKLARVIGREKIVDVFFRGDLAGLRKQVDAKLGAGSLDRAVRFLEAGDGTSALGALEAQKE